VPHISISHFPRTFTEAERAELVTALTHTVTQVFGVEEGAVSIAVEPVEPSRWIERVHTPEIDAKAHLLWKQPNYSQPISAEGTR
jgi:4-oxalocrotonate tautomerase